MGTLRGVSKKRALFTHEIQNEEFFNLGFEDFNEVLMGLMRDVNLEAFFILKSHDEAVCVTLVEAALGCVCVSPFEVDDGIDFLFEFAELFLERGDLFSGGFFCELYHHNMAQESGGRFFEFCPRGNGKKSKSE